MESNFQNRWNFPIWSWERPSKVDCNSALPWGSLILLILTSVGRFDFWQSKWNPNCIIPLFLESRLQDISNELSHTQFGHREGLQNLPEKCTMWQEGNATHLRGATHLSISTSVKVNGCDPLEGCDPLKQQSPEIFVLRLVLIQVDSNNLQVGF